jgi:alpha-tubulin suppressor-like RCC1 family protein
LQESAAKPKIVDALLGEEVIDVACGSRHVVALTSDAQQPVYTWGVNSAGIDYIKLFFCVTNKKVT